MDFQLFPQKYFFALKFHKNHLASLFVRGQPNKPDDEEWKHSYMNVVAWNFGAAGEPALLTPMMVIDAIREYTKEYDDIHSTDIGLVVYKIKGDRDGGYEGVLTDFYEWDFNDQEELTLFSLQEKVG